MAIAAEILSPWRCMFSLTVGVNFADAGLVFMGEVATGQDIRRDYGEDRFVTAGYLNGRMVVLVWTPRDGARHVISMRYCHGREEETWRRRMG